MPMKADTGESTTAINKRGDDAAWPNVLTGLREGGRLKLHHRIGRAALEGLPDSHPCNTGAKTLTISRARRLEREGIIVKSGIDQYMLAPGLDAH